MAVKNKIIKLISAFLIVLILAPVVLFSKPKQVNATGWPVADFLSHLFLGSTGVSTSVNTGLHIKDIALEVLKEVARTFAKRLLAQMTQSTVNWINIGFHGSPLFLENPESFFKDIAKYE